MMDREKKAGLLDGLADGRLAILLLVTLATCFWWPALWHGKLMLHGDAGLHGLPLFWVHGDALAGRESLLWSSRIYGGHPLFAEGQGGFANPLMILSVWLCGPLYALGFVHWLDMLVGGAGVFCLCRLLGISRWSATFASIAVIFSGSWMRHQDDLPAFATLTWLPWLIAAVEYWLLYPSLRRAGIMAIPAALLVFAGYPQIAYGAALYAIVSLTAQFSQRESRAFAFRHGRTLLITGLAAVVLAIGLSAIQFLPLMELVGLSSRNKGVELLFDGVVSPLDSLKVLLYFYLGGDQDGANDANLSSMAVLMVSGLLVFFRAPARIYGHLLGAFLLLNLGMGNVSPLFRILYAYHLIPGVHYFRAMYAFYPVAVVGFAVAAGYALDRLSGDVFAALWGVFRKNKMNLLATGAIFATCLSCLACLGYAPVYAKWSFLAPVLIVLVFALLGLLGKRRWFSLLAVLILSVDVVALRMHAFNFFDRQILEMPPVVRAIAAEPDVQDYRVMEGTLAGLAAFMEPTDPAFGPAYRKALKALSPFPLALQWQVPSINGVLALWLERRDLLEPTFAEEVEGRASTPVGLRLIDILGIRYLSRDAALSSPGLSLYAYDRELNLFIYRNDHAKPRFQVHWDAAAVDNPEQALAGLQAARSETLFVEKQRGEMLTLLAPTVECTGCAASKPAIEVVEAKAMRYRVNVEMPREGWLFLADANYPGWQATVNGTRQPVYSAQVLGKAVRLAAGRNAVTIRYVPWSFYIGAALSAATLLLVIFILLRGRRAAADMMDR